MYTLIISNNNDKFIRNLTFELTITEDMPIRNLSYIISDKINYNDFLILKHNNIEIKSWKKISDLSNINNKIHITYEHSLCF